MTLTADRAEQAKPSRLLLKRLDIYSRSNGHVRGYDRDRFLDAWSRYQVGPPPKEASNRQALNEVWAAAIDTLPVDTGSGEKVVEPLHKDEYFTATREWTLDEVYAYGASWPVTVSCEPPPPSYPLRQLYCGQSTTMTRVAARAMTSSCRCPSHRALKNASKGLEPITYRS